MGSDVREQFRDVDVYIQSLLGPKMRPSLSGSVLPSILSCVDQISRALRTSQQVSSVGTANAFGDEQLNVDVVADRIIRSEAAKCPAIVTLSSEEDPVERQSNSTTSSNDENSTESYTLAFDPLDGSSIIAPNWTVGTIVGIWDGSTALHQPPSTGQVAAVLGVYGPRTTAIVALRVPNAAPTCFEVGFGEKDSVATCEIVRPQIRLSETSPSSKTRYFAPANLRAAAEDKAYLQLITHYVEQKYTLRYSGGLVPDVVHILVKGQGVYISPVTATSKAKLRRLYELAPIALVMECAGASAVDPATGLSILGEAIKDCDERAGLLSGTSEEVDFVKRSFGMQ